MKRQQIQTVGETEHILIKIVENYSLEWYFKLEINSIA